MKNPFDKTPLRPEPVRGVHNTRGSEVNPAMLSKAFNIPFCTPSDPFVPKEAKDLKGTNHRKGIGNVRYAGHHREMMRLPSDDGSPEALSPQAELFEPFGRSLRSATVHHEQDVRREDRAVARRQERNDREERIRRRLEVDIQMSNEKNARQDRIRMLSQRHADEEERRRAAEAARIREAERLKKLGREKLRNVRRKLEKEPWLSSDDLEACRSLLESNTLEVAQDCVASLLCVLDRLKSDEEGSHNIADDTYVAEYYAHDPMVKGNINMANGGKDLLVACGLKLENNFYTLKEAERSQFKRLVARAREILLGIDVTDNFPPQRVAAWARMALYEDCHGSQPLNRIYSTILEECGVDGVTFQAILNEVVMDSDCGEKGNGGFKVGMCDSIRRWLKANNRWTDAHDYKVRSLPNQVAETTRKTVHDLWEQCKVEQSGVVAAVMRLMATNGNEDAMEDAMEKSLHELAASPQGSPAQPGDPLAGSMSTTHLGASASQTSILSGLSGMQGSESGMPSSVASGSDTGRRRWFEASMGMRPTSGPRQKAPTASPKLLKSKGEEKLEAFRLETEHAPQPVHRRKKVYVMKMDDALGPRWVQRWETSPANGGGMIKAKGGGKASLMTSQVHLGSGGKAASTPNLLKQIYSDASKFD